VVKSLYVFFILIFLSQGLTGQVSPGISNDNQYLTKKSIEVFLIEDPPKIDGLLNDEVWKTAPYIDEFYQREPDTGKPVSRPTKVFICFDQKTLYIGFQCFDDPDKIT
jgi:hypothetical protein